MKYLLLPLILGFLTACGPASNDLPNSPDSGSESEQASENPGDNSGENASSETETSTPETGNSASAFPSLSVTIKTTEYTYANATAFLNCAIASSNNPVFKGTFENDLKSLNQAAVGSDEKVAKETLTKVASDISVSMTYAPGCSL